MKPQISEENLNIITQYFLGNTEPFNAMDDNWKNLMLAYATDNNSSTLREAVTLQYLQYTSYTEKHGADGFDPITNRQKEVKPKYVDFGKKIGGGGNFNDMTMDLLETKKDCDIVCSLFAGNSLVYIVEFPISVIFEHLKKPIIRAKIGKRVVCSFSHTNYDSEQLIVHYLNTDIIEKQKCISKPHKKMLENRYAKNR